jgi:uncharacterized protein
MLLAAQGLCHEPASPVSGDDAYAAICRMGLLQIDTIHVVARSPYFVLWSRLGDYDQHLLDHLLASQRLFEYWAHAACFIPVEQFPLHRRLIVDRRRHPSIYYWLKANEEAVNRVSQFVLENRVARSSDFERTDGAKGNWWNWKEEKIALESLHTAGELMILERRRFQRIYAHRTTVLPHWSDDALPGSSDVIPALTAIAVRCLGVTMERWIADYYRFKESETASAIKRLLECGEVVEASIEGLTGRAYLHRDHLGLAQQVLDGSVTAFRTTLLSPFDPIVWDRSRGRELFGFDYTIECYTKEAKRIYGYFTLPILYRDRLVGRLDAKAHRVEKRFEVKALHFEAGFLPHEDAIDAIGKAIRECAIWHKTPKVEIVSCSIRGLAAKIEKAARKRRSSSRGGTP